VLHYSYVIWAASVDERLLFWSLRPGQQLFFAFSIYLV